MKNKEITIYELIGLIKDDKAPKKVKYLGATYEYDGEDYYLEVCDDEEEACCSLFDRLQNFNSIKGLLTLTVEILPEENDEWEDIEELEIYTSNYIYDKEEIHINRETINKLIKNQRKIIEKLEGKYEK